MLLLVIGTVILVSPFAMRAYYRFATARLRRAPRAWEALEKHARVLLEDRHLNPVAGDFVEFTLSKAGSGSITRTVLWSLLTGWLIPDHDEDAERLFASLNGEQEQQLFRFMVASLLYDSFRTPIAGGVIRRAL